MKKMPTSRQISIVLSIFIWNVLSCSTSTLKHSSQDLYQKVYAPYFSQIGSPHNFPNTENQQFETLAIVGLNDIHGALSVQKAKTRELDETKRMDYEKGGAVYLASQIKKLRQEYGSRLLVLDAGDEFQGSLESNFEEGKSVVAFLNELQINAAAIGNHEFDFGPSGPDEKAMPNADPLGALKDRMKEANYPYLAANVYHKKTGQLYPFPNTVPSVLLQAGQTKVGIIGLSTLETPTTTRAEFVASLKFQDLKEATLRESRKLRVQGAEVILVVAHVGLHCQAEKVVPSKIISQSDYPSNRCNEKDEMTRLLNSLPSGVVDAVVSGHTHTLVYHWVNNIPVIQGGTRNTYFNTLYLTIDRQSKKVKPELTQIEAEVPICPTIFSNQMNCNGEQSPPSEGRGSLIAPVFHKTIITPDQSMANILKPYFDKTEKLKQEVVGTTQTAIDHHRKQESPLGNLAADAVRESVGADFGLINGGGIRAPIEQGQILYENVFRTFPFDNFVSVLEVTGKELKLILQVAQSGAKGIFPVSGLKIKMLSLNAPLPEERKKDLNGDGKVEEWEHNRILEVSTSQNQKIDDKKLYRLATIDFLVTGGDYMDFPMKKIKAERIKFNAGPVIRDVLVEHLKKLSPIQLEPTSKNPRFEFAHQVP